MTPDQAIRLLSVEEWPPKLEHWPPRDKSQWRPGMFLQGIIEAVMTLPRPDGSKRRGEPYLVMYIRRLDNGRLVMWHGWHTAAEDVPAMQPAPGLLFTSYYRGERDNGYEDFKQLVTPYDPPAQAENNQTRQGTGQAEGRRTQAPEGEAEGSRAASPSGSRQQPGEFDVELPPINRTDEAKAYCRQQSRAWQRDFRRKAEAAKESGSLANLPPLQMWIELIIQTWAGQGVGAWPHPGKAA